MRHTAREVKLSNGAKGLLIDVPDASVVSFQFHFLAGSRFVEDVQAYETAHIMEHMAFGANSKFKDAQDFGAEFERNGAHYNAYTSDLSMVYVADCADFEWERILSMQGLAITCPKFIKEELVSESGNVKNELTGYLNSHPRLLWPKMQIAMGEPVLDYAERLKRLNNTTLEHIKNHYKNTHTSKNMRFSVAGNLTPERSEKIIKSLENWKLPKGEREDVPSDEIKSAKPFLIKRKEASNLTFALSLALPKKLNNQELDAMAAVDHILTGTLHSRILGAARKQGLAYGMFSEATAYHFFSTWDFAAQVNLETVEPLFEIMVREIKAILNGEITEEEVEKAKQYALGKHQMGAQTVGQINNWYGGRYFFDEYVDDFDKRPEAIKQINKNIMVEVAREFARHKTWVLGGVGKNKKELMDKLDDKLTGLF